MGGWQVGGLCYAAFLIGSVLALAMRVPDKSISFWIGLWVSLATAAGTIFTGIVALMIARRDRARQELQRLRADQSTMFANAVPFREFMQSIERIYARGLRSTVENPVYAESTWSVVRRSILDRSGAFIAIVDRMKLDAVPRSSSIAAVVAARNRVVAFDMKVRSLDRATSEYGELLDLTGKIWRELLPDHTVIEADLTEVTKEMHAAERVARV